MPAKHQYFAVKLPKNLSRDQREAIGLDILQRIRERSQQQNIDKNGNRFPAYTKQYVQSLDFKNAGKSKGNVNVTLSGDMLAAMDILKNSTGEIVLGFKKGTEENARADGNIRGTYGQDRANSKKARDFLGLPKYEIDQILKRYKSKEVAEIRLGIEESATIDEVKTIISEQLDEEPEE